MNTLSCDNCNYKVDGITKELEQRKQNADSSDLLSCPFCGNKDVREVIRPHFDIGTIAVECGSCRTRGPEYRINMKDKYSRLHKLWWNTRPGCVDKNNLEYD
jgi:hypothetical protein